MREGKLYDLSDCNPKEYNLLIHFWVDLNGVQRALWVCDKGTSVLYRKSPHLCPRLPSRIRVLGGQVKNIVILLPLGNGTSTLSHSTYYHGFRQKWQWKLVSLVSKGKNRILLLWIYRIAYLFHSNHYVQYFLHFFHHMKPHIGVSFRLSLKEKRNLNCLLSGLS